MSSHPLFHIDTSYQALIIGLGQIAFGYDAELPMESPFIRTHVKSLLIHPNFSIKAVFDPCHDALKRFSLRYPCISTFSSLSSALIAHQFDVIIISSPTDFHLVHLSSVITHPGLKAVLLEKPLTTDLSELRAYRHILKTSQVPIFLNFIRRADSAILQYRKLLNGALHGHQFSGIAFYSGSLFISACHHIDLLCHLFGLPCRVNVLDSPSFATADTPSLTLEYVNGVITLLPTYLPRNTVNIIEVTHPQAAFFYNLSGIASLRSESLEVSNAFFAKSRFFQYQLDILNLVYLELRGIPTAICGLREAIDCQFSYHSVL